LWERDGDRANFETAIQKYREADEFYPLSKLATRAQFLMGYAYFQNENYFGSLRIFQKYLRENKGTSLTDRAGLQVARSFMKMGHFEEALKNYENIETNATLEELKIEATYLKGDVPFKNKNYEEAAKFYEVAIKKYPVAVDKYPNAFYNKAECNFWLGKYKKGLDDYRDFLSRFPAHAYAGYAMTRLGELLQILGADEKQIMGAYLETYFRYGDTPGAVVARMRTLSKKMSTMKEKEAEEAIKEIQNLSQKSHLPKIDLFSTLSIAEGLENRNQHAEGLKRLLNWYQFNPTDPDLSVVSNRIVQMINDQMYYAVENGKFMEALKFHNTYGEQWLSKSDRIDTLFVLGRAFEQAGSYKDAEQLYRETFNRIKALKGTKNGKSRSVFERLPSEDDINLRLARVAKDNGNYKAAYDYLREVKNYDKLNELQQVERVMLSAQVLEKKGELESAKRYLKDIIDNWRGKVGLVVEPTIQLAKLQVKTNQKEEAEKNLKNSLILIAEAEKIPSTIHSETLSNLAEIQLLQNKNEELIQTWDELLKNYEEKQPLESVRFRLGELYFKNGNIQKATEIWNPLKSKKNLFWYKLADENLKNSEWKSGYKKYIQRIPAMADMKGTL
jgi:tetratricopeptide (TPR) repeat protein